MPQLVVSGLTLGAVYALVALGLLLIFSAARVVNFAQGQLLMIGAYLAIAAQVRHGLPAWAAYGLTLAAMALLGVVFMLVAWRPLRGRPTHLVILTTIAMGIILENLALIVWGPLPVSLPAPLVGRPWRVAGGVITMQQMFVMGTTMLALVALSLFMTRSRFGVLMRATAQDLDMARLVGIRVDRTIAAAFAIGSGLAGLAGLLVAPLYLAEPTMGGSLGLKGFVVAVVGGFGNLPGAVVGGLGLGLIEAFAARYVSAEYRDAVAFIIMIAMLCVRPRGLFGETVGERV